MVDNAPQFESKDILGTTTTFNGTVGTGVVSVPAVAGNVVAEALVRQPSGNPTYVLYVCFDGSGATFHALKAGEYIGWALKGAPTQIQIKGSHAAVPYEITLNREP
jgi:hypothetical protein